MEKTGFFFRYLRTTCKIYFPLVGDLFKLNCSVKNAGTDTYFAIEKLKNIPKLS